MRFPRRYFYLSAILLTPFLTADTIDTSSDIEDHDIQALREWIYTKRQVTIGEKGGALSISGEVRGEFQHTTEVKDGIKQRGGGGALRKDGFPYPSSGYDVEVNLMFDYRTDRTWASIKLEFDNNAGVFSGDLRNIRLERAFLGGRLVDEETLTVDGIIGRNRLSSFFDSKIEYGSFFDGILLRYDQNFEMVDFYVHPGVFIIDERQNHYGYVAEVGFLNIAGTGLYSKYSVIDWDTKHYSDEITVKGVKEPSRNNARFDFIVSQLILGYKCRPEWLNKRIFIMYLAGLYNHVAKERKLTDYKKANFGGYVGFSIGELRKKNDWSFDANYQVLAAQCVPDFDSFGITIGQGGFYNSKTDGSGAPTTRKTAEGNVNYRGFQLTFEYLLTNNINILQTWQQSITLDKDIGPFRRYKQYEIEFIYLF